MKTILPYYKDEDISFSHISFTYVDRDFWTPSLRQFFSGYIDNLTDFNDSKCFTYWINLSKNKHPIGTEEFTRCLLRDKALFLLQIEISIIGPFIRNRYIKYFTKNKGIEMEWKDDAYRSEDEYIMEKIDMFTKAIKHRVLSNEELFERLPREDLREIKNDSSVYEFFFQQKGHLD